MQPSQGAAHEGASPQAVCLSPPLVLRRGYGAFLLGGGWSKSAAAAGQPVVLICRSGNRSVDAGHALEAAGFTSVYNVVYGFEGDLGENHHRNEKNGWRHDGLPWEQT